MKASALAMAAAGQPPLVLMVHEAGAWLVWGDWSRPVNVAEFRAWAAYSGVNLRPIRTGESCEVLLETSSQKRLFDLMWRSF